MESKSKSTSNEKPKSSPFTLTTKDGTPIVPLRQIVSQANPFADQMPATLMTRPAFNSSGKQAAIAINSHRVLSYPTKEVHQYDVSSGELMIFVYY